MKRAIRIISLIVCIAFCVALIVSGAFIMIHSAHDCDASGCRVCAGLRMAESLMSSLKFICIAAFFAYVGLFLSRSACAAVRFLHVQTPVLLRQKLLN